MAHITSSYNETSRIITVTVTGQVSGKAISEFLIQMANEYRHLSELYVVSDYSQGQIEVDPSYFLANLNSVLDIFSAEFASYNRFCNAYVLDDADISSTKILLDQFIKRTSYFHEFHTKFFTINLVVKYSCIIM